MAEFAPLVCPAHVRQFAAEMYDVELTQEESQKVARQAIGFWLLRFLPHNGLTYIWVKKRLGEAMLLWRGPPVDESEPWVSGVFHMWNMMIDPAEVDQWLVGSGMVSKGVQRSVPVRSPLATLSPIDRVAAKLVHFPDHTGCPYCKKWFRNGIALRLHVAEFHGLEVMYAD